MRGLPLVLVAVVRADGMDDVVHAEAVRPGDHGVADLAPAEGAALLEQAGSGGGVDRAVDSPAAEQARVRGVDDRADPVGSAELRDVAAVDEDLHGVSLHDGQSSALVGVQWVAGLAHDAAPGQEGVVVAGSPSSKNSHRVPWSG